MAVTLLKPITSTGTLESIVELFPSWPEKLPPQHFTVRKFVIAHVCEKPTDIEITLLNPTTSTGALESTIELFPRDPPALRPSTSHFLDL